MTAAQLFKGSVTSRLLEHQKTTIMSQHNLYFIIIHDEHVPSTVTVLTGPPTVFQFPYGFPIFIF